MGTPTSNNQALCDSVLVSRRALFVGAHPDDIEFRAGGLVHLMRKRGTEVIFAIATRGGRQLPGLLRRTLERARMRYQERAAEILGGAEVVLLDYPDGSLSSCVESLSNEVKSLVEDRQPDLIMSWDPDHISTPHPDHKAAALAVKAIETSIRTCFYGTASPNLWVPLDEDDLEAKIAALKAHRTETPWFYFDLLQKPKLIVAMRANGSQIARALAETYRVP